MGTAVKAVLGTVLAVLLIIGAWFAITQFQRGTADYRGETGVIENTEANAQFRMQAYDEFFDLCASVQTYETRIEALEEELESAEGTRANELKTALTANKAQRAGLINQYNVDASKEWTVGQFQSQDLPFKLDIEKEKTTCAL